MRRTIRVVALAGTLAVGATACSAGDDSGSKAVDARDDSGGGLAVTPAEAGGLDLATITRDERSLIHTAERTIAVENVDSARTKAIEKTETVGGFVDHEEAELGGSPRVTLVLKVPPAEYRDVLDALEDLGEVIRRSESTEDVTQQVVDVDARISSAETSVDRLRELLEGQGSLNDIVTLERELTTRIADLESLRAVQRALDEQIDNATITLHLRKPPKTASSGEPSEKIPGFLRGLKTGWGAFVNVVLGIITVVGFALPFAAATALLFLVTRPLWRRIRRRRAAAENWDPDPTPDPSPVP